MKMKVCRYMDAAFCPMWGRTKFFRKFLSWDKNFSENFYPRTKKYYPIGQKFSENFYPRTIF